MTYSDWCDWCDCGMHDAEDHEVLVWIDLHQRTIHEGVRDCYMAAVHLIDDERTGLTGAKYREVKGLAHQVRHLIDCTDADDTDDCWDENADQVDRIVWALGLQPTTYDGTWFVLTQPRGDDE